MARGGVIAAPCWFVDGCTCAVRRLTSGNLRFLGVRDGFRDLSTGLYKYLYLCAPLRRELLIVCGVRAFRGVPVPHVRSIDVLSVFFVVVSGALGLLRYSARSLYVCVEDPKILSHIIRVASLFHHSTRPVCRLRRDRTRRYTEGLRSSSVFYTPAAAARTSSARKKVRASHPCRRAWTTARVEQTKHACAFLPSMTEQNENQRHLPHASPIPYPFS